MNKFWITFWFYAKENFNKKSCFIYAGFFAATIAAIFGITHFGGTYTDIAIVENSTEFTIAPEMFEGIERRNFLFLDSETEATELFDAGEVDDVFLIEGSERPELTILSNHATPDSLVEMALTQVLMAQHLEAVIANYDLPLNAVMELNTPLTVNFEGAEVTDGMVAADIISFALPYALMMFIMMSGQALANSVSSEKNSRVMEVMLAKVSPTYSMVAKVLATFIGVLLPLLAIIVGFLVSEIFGLIELESFAQLIEEFFPVHVLFLLLIVFILGYFCYIFLFSAAGAISASVESLMTTLAPLTYFLMVPMLLPMFLDLDHIVMDILVYVPLVSPFIIVQRYLTGYSNQLEVGISLGLMAVFALVTLFVSARLYMNGVSHTSEKVTFKDLRKMMQK